MNKQAIAERRKEGRKPVQPSPRKTVPDQKSSSPHPPHPPQKIRNRSQTKILSLVGAPPHSSHEEPSAGHTRQQVLLAHFSLPRARARSQNGTSQSAGLTHQPHDRRLDLKRGNRFTHCLGYNLFLGLPDLERYPGKERRGNVSASAAGLEQPRPAGLVPGDGFWGEQGWTPGSSTPFCAACSPSESRRLC